MTIADDIKFQIEYVANSAHFYCSHCKKKIILNDLRLCVNLKDDIFKCKCGALYKLPFYYLTTYHNKHIKEVKYDRYRKQKSRLT